MNNNYPDWLTIAKIENFQLPTNVGFTSKFNLLPDVELVVTLSVYEKNVYELGPPTYIRVFDFKVVKEPLERYCACVSTI